MIKNVKADSECVDVDWIQVVQDRAKWMGLVNTVMNETDVLTVVKIKVEVFCADTVY
jgi:uncharacterized protein (DUF169 family)